MIAIKLTLYKIVDNYFLLRINIPNVYNFSCKLTAKPRKLQASPQIDNNYLFNFKRKLLFIRLLY